ncbi:MAG TPA: glycosyltransferase family 1 protein [Pyrinomonadaceae bacterium]|nr:glycosyltransferase family 1 protein [Pyrinomonadaceae bacterium]
MKIGVDATCWENKRGFGRFTRELLDALLTLDDVNEYLFFVDGDSNGHPLPARAKAVKVNTGTAAIEAAAAGGRRSLKDLWSMSRTVAKHDVDVFFFPAVYSYFPIMNRTKIVVTLHDVIADHHPDLIFPDKKSKYLWKLKQFAAMKQASLIATVSDYSKREIIDYFNVRESRLRVISEAARPVFRSLRPDSKTNEALERNRLSPTDKFLLYVGGISPHKNLAALIDAFAAINGKPEAADIKLVLVGDYKDDPFFSAYPSLKLQVEKLGLEGRVLFAGFVPDDDLAYLYNAATLVVLPSFEEGFGLPAIEAMACGAPVAASNCGSLPEVLGDAGRYFDPHDSADVARVLGELLVQKETRTAMSDTGLCRSQNFTWRKAAIDTLKIFDELAGS